MSKYVLLLLIYNVPNNTWIKMGFFHKTLYDKGCCFLQSTNFLKNRQLFTKSIDSFGKHWYYKNIKICRIMTK